VTRRRAFRRPLGRVPAAALILWAASTASFAQPSPPAPAGASAPDVRDMTVRGDGWRLVWADEFEGEPCPDPARWRHEEGFVRNQELQWYGRGNAFCENGVLVIEARREAVTNPRYNARALDWQLQRQNAQYTSASLFGSPPAAWQYGRLELRARIDTGAGLWPAFWTTGVVGQWPRNGEIDVLEYYANAFTVAALWQAGQRSERATLESLGGADWAAQFHVWRMEWDPDKIEVWVDAIRLASFAVSDARNPDGSYPFRQPHVVRLNLAVGGTMGGDPSGTRFPARFEIDWLRVYQKGLPDSDASPPR